MGEAAAAGAGAFPWEGAAIADPFADADGPGRAFRLSAAPEETLGLTPSGGTLLDAQHGHGSASAAAGGGSRPAGCHGAAAALTAQLAAASTEPCWPLYGGDASTACGSGTESESDAKASSMGGIEGASLQRNAAAAPPQPAQQLFSAMASEPGAGTSFSKSDDAAGSAANDGPPGTQQHAAEQQQRAEEAVPAAPGTPQRRSERPAGLGSRHGSGAAPVSAGGSPRKARRQPKIQPSAAATLRHDGAAPGSSPAQLRHGGEGEAATASLLRVQVEEARPAQTALLALQVHLPFYSVGNQHGQGDRECNQSCA